MELVKARLRTESEKMERIEGAPSWSVKDARVRVERSAG
jgi:hypothetical protein